MPDSKDLSRRQAKTPKNDPLSATRSRGVEYVYHRPAPLHADDQALLRDALKRFQETPGKVPTIIPPEKKGGVMAFFGKWPGEETEQELLEALKSLD